MGDEPRGSQDGSGSNQQRRKAAAAGWDPRSKEELMATAEKVASLDSRRINKHIAAGRWHLVPEHLRHPSEASEHREEGGSP